MKNYICILFAAFLSHFTFAQKSSVEPSLYGVQIGLLGVWGQQEARLSNQIALRTELGFDAGIWGGDLYNETGFALAPVLTLEPRWYYNLNKRVKRSRNISGNSGNFLAFSISYHPDWFTISNTENVEVFSDISLIPTWGIRRVIGKHFTYETGIGIGYRYFFDDFIGNQGEIAVNLHLRIGYSF